MRMNKLALRAIARMTRIDITTAAKAVRHNPILDSEINIDEELINLKESLDTYHVAGDTLKQYPAMRAHFIRERYAIMQHCIGLVERMLRGRRLSFAYEAADIDHAIRRMIYLLVDDARRAGRRIDRDVMEVFLPFMSLRQRVAMREFGMDMVVRASQLPRIYSFSRGVLRRGDARA